MPKRKVNYIVGDEVKLTSGQRGRIFKIDGQFILVIEFGLNFPRQITEKEIEANISQIKKLP